MNLVSQCFIHFIRSARKLNNCEEIILLSVEECENKKAFCLIYLKLFLGARVGLFSVQCSWKNIPVPRFRGLLSLEEGS